MPQDGAPDEMLDLLKGLRAQADQLTSNATPSQNIAELRWGDPVAVNYTFERTLYEDEGRFVLLVRHRMLDRRFALKLIPAELQTDPTSVARLKNDAEAVSRLGHENIVFVTNFGESPAVGHFYVMEYLNGETLASLLLGGSSAPEKTVIELAAQAGAALSAAHDVGLTHRSVTPTKLMSHRIESDEVWKLLDFGMVADLQEPSDNPSDGEYLAPEIRKGEGATAASDQFSLAATLFHAHFGQTPWPTGTQTCSGPIDFPDSTSEGLRSAFGRALAEAPAERFPTVDDFVAALLRQLQRPQKPRIAPHEVFEARRVLDGSGDAEGMTVGMTFSDPTKNFDPNIDPSSSLEISVADISGMRPTFTMTFRSARRLRREWRKNLIGWAALIPTDRRLESGSPLILEIDYAPGGVSASFQARVTARVHFPVLGLAVEIEPEDRELLHEFISGLELAAFTSDAKFVDKVSKHSVRLSNDEAFVFEKLQVGMTVGELRRLFSNLPLAVDDVIARLEEKKLVQIEGTRPSQHISAEPEVPDAEGVNLVIERADSLREQGNHPGEIELLAVASERYQSPDLFRRLAMAQLQFNYDLEAAISALERVVELDPNDSASADRLESLKKFSTFAPNV